MFILINVQNSVKPTILKHLLIKLIQLSEKLRAAEKKERS
jgi:hypothetical protein